MIRCESYWNNQHSNLLAMMNLLSHIADGDWSFYVWCPPLSLPLPTSIITHWFIGTWVSQPILAFIGWNYITWCQCLQTLIGRSEVDDVILWFDWFVQYHTLDRFPHLRVVDVITSGDYSVTFMLTLRSSLRLWPLTSNLHLTFNGRQASYAEAIFDFIDPITVNFGDNFSDLIG